MTHQYCASDLASLPQPALDALGVSITGATDDGVSLLICGAQTFGLVLPPDHAAALLLGLVHGKAEAEFAVHAQSFGGFVARFDPPADSELDDGVFAPTPLAAVMAAYAKAVQG
jgi:hypothetical protein